MQRDTANGIVSRLREWSNKLNQSAQLVQDTCTKEEFQSYRTAVGKIMGCMYFDIMDPIFKEHPDLLPDSFK